jgi:DNA polymerase V
LQGKPTVVLSNNDGCVIALSKEAKALKIPFGMPYFKMMAMPEYGHVQVRSANFTLYGDMSNRVMNTIALNVPDMEIYSIDECFIDYNGVADAENHAKKLCETVRQWTGIAICIGLGPTKTLAKLANKKAKKESCGAVDVTDMGIRNAILTETKIGDIWGIGRRWRARLLLQGIETAYDLSRMERRLARNMMGVVGLRTVDELNGISCQDLELITPDKQNLCISRSFSNTIHTLGGMKERIHYFSTRASEKLRSGELVASAISVFVRGNSFRPELPQYSNSVTVSLDGSTSDTGAILNAALYGLNKIYRPGVPYKKAGVLLLDLHSKEQAPRNLFTKSNPQREKLMHTMDRLNSKFGPGAVSYGQVPQSRTWYMSQKMLSNRFTTHWRELLVAK